MTDKTPWFGYLNLALAQTIVGVNAVIGKYLADKVPLFIFICGRFLIGSVILLVLFKLSKEPLLTPEYANGPNNKLTTKEWTWLTAQAVTGGLLFNLLFFGGLCFTTASSAGIISSTLPAMIAICAWIFLKESLSSRKILAIMLAVTGIFIISLDNGMGKDAPQGHFLGDSLILLAMFPEALFSIFGRLLGKRVNPLASAAIVTTICWLTTIPFGLYDLVTQADYGLSTWHVMLIFFSGASTVIFYYCCNKGLAVVEAGISAVFGSLFPVSATILAWLFLDERLGMYDFIGMLVILTSIVVGAELRRVGRNKVCST
jgi:drug/metabolite transporter (DMT)-like permease